MGCARDFYGYITLFFSFSRGAPAPPSHSVSPPLIISIKPLNPICSCQIGVTQLCIVSYVSPDVRS
ncbi:hypothetical protein HanIR_Chr09g0402401 [Helianthus annuus]|nr:hypothetical protein HanIR_Chr09g0402401 [Helianthus annuus]